MVMLMSVPGEAEAYLEQIDAARRPIASEAHAILVEHGCASYVKTIYIGYEIDGEMAAALYAHADRVEIALALAEDAESPLLVDAAHLTWRTLPVAAELRVAEDLPEFATLAAEAVGRVRHSKHAVSRDNDFFMARKGRRRAAEQILAHRPDRDRS